MAPGIVVADGLKEEPEPVVCRVDRGALRVGIRPHLGLVHGAIVRDRGCVHDLPRVIYAESFLGRELLCQVQAGQGAGRRRLG